jgi:predicted DNA-binding protein with PD1-like motif
MLCTPYFMLAACFAAATALSPESDAQWYRRKELSHETGSFASSRVHVLRLGPNEDLLDSLYRYARVLNIGAASIVSTVGSLKKTSIRYANQEDGGNMTGHFEIVSLVGNVDMQSASKESEDAGHIHISVSTETGETIGGHLLSGSIVYTTAEITLLEIVHATFDREPDTQPGGSGYYELKVWEDIEPQPFLELA